MDEQSNTNPENQDFNTNYGNQPPTNPTNDGQPASGNLAAQPPYQGQDQNSAPPTQHTPSWWQQPPTPPSPDQYGEQLPQANRPAQPDNNAQPDTAYPSRDQNSPPFAVPPRAIDYNTGEASAAGSTDFAPPAKSRSSKKFIPLAGVLIIIILALAAGWYFLLSKQPGPDEVFRAALANALSTSQVEQSIKSTDMSADLKFDSSDIQDPIIASTMTIKVFQAKTVIDGYGTLKNTYMKYSSMGGNTGDASQNSIINQWVQLRKNGQLDNKNANRAGLTTTKVFDPRVGFFGQYIFGDFSVSDRTDLMNYLINNQVYSYDSAKVNDDTIDGHDVYVYPVTINDAKLVEFNKKVAKIIGLATDDPIFQETLAGLSQADDADNTYQLFVRRDTNRLIEVKASSPATTITYSNYDSVKMPSEPQKAISFAEFTKQLTANTP